MMNRIEIRDFASPELSVYASLSENQLKTIYEPCDGLFIAESPKVITRAIQSGCEPVSFLSDSSNLNGEARELLENAGDVPVYTAPDAVLSTLTGFHLTRGLLCAMKRPHLSDAADLIRNAHRVAVLENVVNPTNVGAIFRSAAALGMEAVLLTPSCSDPLYRRSARVSMGTVFQIPWTYLPETDGRKDRTDMALLKTMGFKSAAMALRTDSCAVDDPRLKAEDRLAVILGNEGDGLTDETLDACDYTVCIPMTNGVDSLNVAAASAVVFYSLSGRNKGGST